MKFKYIIVIATILLTLSCQKSTHKSTKAPAHLKSTVKYTEGEVKPNSGFFTALSDLGLKPQQIIEVTNILADFVDVRSIQVGDKFKFSLTSDGKKINDFYYYPDIVTTHQITRGDDGKLVYKLVEEKTDKIKRLVIGELKTTLDAALLDKKLAPNLKQQANQILESKVNFQRDAKVGDEFIVLVEERFYKKEKLPGGKLYYVAYNGKRTGLHEGFRFDDPADEKSAYNGLYFSDGASLVTAAYRMPLDHVHVNSSYGMRLHPISGTWRMHAGTDFKANTGTPVYAITTGKVKFAAWNGGMGKEVEIKHDNGFTSVYAHLNSISVSRGATVKKGQRIGGVGSTGYSTGPHLHFGLKNSKNSWINPSNIKMISTAKLSGNRLTSFKNQVSKIREMVKQFEKTSHQPNELTKHEKLLRKAAKKI